MGVDPKNLRLRQHLKDELAHYSSACFDIEYNFPFGWKEIHGNADRSNFDLGQHQKFSKKSLEVFDEASKKKILPVVIEPSQGVDRALLAFMFEAYNDDKKRGNIVLKLDPKLAPVKVGIFPLVNKDKLPDMAVKVYENLRNAFTVQYDKSGSIGRRYARADEIGVPFCITIDFDSIKNKDVTIRNRDTTEQKRVKITKLMNVFVDLIYHGKRFEDI
jgi:glycyl-tRNA synthetase